MSLRNGEWDLALQEYSAIQERARELPLQRYLDEATWGLARAQAATGDLEQAIVVYEQLLERPQLSTAVPRELVAGHLMMAYAECGDLNRSIDVGEAAVAAMEDSDPVPDVGLQVELISTLAGCYLERGDLVRAQLLIDRALAKSDEDGSPRARAAAAWNAALISQARHDAVGARRHIDRAGALYAEIDDARRTAVLRGVSAHLALRAPEPDVAAALAQVERAIDELSEVGTQLDLGYARTERARALLIGGDLAGAREAGRQALRRPGERRPASRPAASCSCSGAWRWPTTTATSRSRSTGRPRTPWPRRRRPARPARVWRELGEAYVELGQHEEAIEALRRASDLAGASYNPLRSGARV